MENKKNPRDCLNLGENFSMKIIYLPIVGTSAFQALAS